MAASVVASVALPISNNFSFAPSMDAYGKLSEYGKLGAWSPLSLFAASEVGVWYDPSDLTTMFQDSAGTTPVTADGQTVGKILDKSGRGNHAVAPSDAARPLYKTDGGLHWLQFDGVDDRVSSASLDLSGTSTATLLLGLLRPNDSGYKMYAEFGPPDTTGGFYFASRSSVSGYEVGLKGSSGQTVAVTDTSAPPITDIATIELDYLQPTNATEIVIRVNGVVESTSQVGQPSAGDGPFGNLALNVGCRSDGSLPVTGNIYSMIFLGRTATTQEITDTETWVAEKTGVTL